MDFPWEKLRPRTVDGISGLYLAIVQDSDSDELLMAAFTNREAIEKTFESGVMHYYSTSRKKIWRKGESSGNVQELVDVSVDCDGDALLFRVKQTGGACHTGFRSCFYRKLAADGKLETSGEKVFDPEKVYPK